MAEKSEKLLSMTEEELNARHADKMRKKKLPAIRFRQQRLKRKGW